MFYHSILSLGKGSVYCIKLLAVIIVEFYRKSQTLFLRSAKNPRSSQLDIPLPFSADRIELGQCSAADMGSAVILLHDRILLPYPQHLLLNV